VVSGAASLATHAPAMAVDDAKAARSGDRVAGGSRQLPGTVILLAGVDDGFLPTG